MRIGSLLARGIPYPSPLPQVMQLVLIWGRRRWRPRVQSHVTFHPAESRTGQCASPTLSETFPQASLAGTWDCKSIEENHVRSLPSLLLTGLVTTRCGRRPAGKGPITNTCPGHTSHSMEADGSSP